MLIIRKKTIAIHAVSFCGVMRKICITLLISITTMAPEKKLLSNQYDLLLWHAPR